MESISAFCLRIMLETIREQVGDDRARVEAIPSLDGGRVQLMVNWLAPGEVSPSEAAEFADAILRAAQLAQACPANGAKVVFA